MHCRNVSISSVLMWTLRPMLWLSKSSIALQKHRLTPTCYRVILGMSYSMPSSATVIFFTVHTSGHNAVYFRTIQSLLQQLPGNTYEGDIDGMLLDLGISSMQVKTLTYAMHFISHCRRYLSCFTCMLLLFDVGCHISRSYLKVNSQCHTSITLH